MTYLKCLHNFMRPNYLQMVPQQCYLERRYPNRSYGKLEALTDGPPKQPKDLADFEVKTIQSNTK